MFNVLYLLTQIIDKFIIILCIPWHTNTIAYYTNGRVSFNS